jgi:hypothetical protein
MRLGFWLDRALTGAEARAWLTGTIADPSIYSANQLIYAATPVFKSGRANPVARRSGIVEGRTLTVTPGDISARRVKVPVEVKPKPKAVSRQAPDGVVFETDAAIVAGRELIERALASDDWKDPRREAPTPSGARAYKIAARLKDQALSPELITDLLIDMVPWFEKEDRQLIDAMVESAFLHGQNDPGCGPPDSAVLLFGESLSQWEAETEESKELWDQIIASSDGAIQRLPDVPPPIDFPLGFTEEVRRIIAEDQAELARRLQ